MSKKREKEVEYTFVTYVGGKKVDIETPEGAAMVQAAIIRGMESLGYKRMDKTAVEE